MADKNGDPVWWGDVEKTMERYREGSRMLSEAEAKGRESIQTEHQPQNSNFDSSSSDGSPNILISLLGFIALVIVISLVLGMLGQILR